MATRSPCEATSGIHAAGCSPCPSFGVYSVATLKWLPGRAGPPATNTFPDGKSVAV